MTADKLSKDVPKNVYIGITFTHYDEDLLDWINMLISSGQSPRTWVRAILIAEETNKALDAGTVCSIPSIQNVPVGSGRHSESSVVLKHRTGWEIRGINLGKAREFLIGSVLTINSNNKVIVDMVKRLQEEGTPVSQYAKVCIRKHIRVVTTGRNQPPDYKVAKEILTLSKSRPSKSPTTTQKEPVQKQKAPVEAPSKSSPKPSPTPPVSAAAEDTPSERKKRPNSLLQYIS